MRGCERSKEWISTIAFIYLHESCTGSFAVKIRCYRDMKAQEQFVKNENYLFMSFQELCFFTAISQMFSVMSCDVPCLIVSTKPKIVFPYLFPKWMLLIFLFIEIFFFSSFIVIGQCRWDRKQSGRKRGVGSGKTLESGFELGMPVTQQCIMLTS